MIDEGDTDLSNYNYALQYYILDDRETGTLDEWPWEGDHHLPEGELLPYPGQPRLRPWCRDPLSKNDGKLVI